jgi:transposase-like protein
MLATMSCASERIEAIISMRRRRRWSTEERLPAMKEFSILKMTLACVSRKIGMIPSLVIC